MRMFLCKNLVPNRFLSLSKAFQNIAFISKTPYIHSRFISKTPSIQRVFLFTFVYRVVHKPK